MSEMVGCHVGLSDHTLGIGVAVASIALGARVIEEHFTISRNEGGVDSAFSMEPHEMKELVRECTNAFLALGSVSYDPSEKERKSFQFRRSIYAVTDIKPGDQFSSDNIRIIRPNGGLEPRFYDTIIGKTCSKEIKRGTPLSLDHLL